MSFYYSLLIDMAAWCHNRRIKKTLQTEIKPRHKFHKSTAKEKGKQKFCDHYEKKRLLHDTDKTCLLSSLITREVTCYDEVLRTYRLAYQRVDEVVVRTENDVCAVHQFSAAVVCTRLKQNERNLPALDSGDPDGLLVNPLNNECSAAHC